MPVSGSTVSTRSMTDALKRDAIAGAWATEILQPDWHASKQSHGDE